MSIKIYKKEDQAYGEFNDGAIVENKPVGFPQDDGKLKPYSNLFYWASAFSEEGSVIELHPHQGFEILSFVVKGSIEHFDTKIKQWKSLNEGDIQIIRAGSGISHAEKINAGSRMFQIWFDPDLSVTLQKPASYDDYRGNKFPVLANDNGVAMKIYAGEGSPLRMESPDIIIREYIFNPGDHQIDITKDHYLSAYLIEGSIEVMGNNIIENDFFLIDDDVEYLNLKVNNNNSKLFVIENPKTVAYKTYMEIRQARQ